jgi:cysteine desulfurase
VHFHHGLLIVGNTEYKRKGNATVIYLDHNATTPLHPRVFEAMVPYLKKQWGNPSSPYRFGSDSKGVVERARERLAEHLGCRALEIVFTSSGTESDNLAVRGVAHALRDRGNHIITTSIEHHAVLNTCRALETEGYRVTYLKVNEDGIIDMEELAESLSPDTILVTIMHANNETGVIQPLDRISTIVKENGVLLHSDAVQTAGKIPLHLEELNADLVSISGHKFYGPKGTAALYIRNGTPLIPMLTGGLHEHGLRAGTENIAGIIGLTEAMVLAIKALDSESKRMQKLRDLLEQGIRSKVPKIRLNGASAARVPNTSNISFDSVDGESIVLGFDLKGICVYTGSACSTSDPEPSHVLRAMGLSKEKAKGSIRFSLGMDNQEEDINFTIQAVIETVGRLRDISSIETKLESPCK